MSENESESGIMRGKKRCNYCKGFKFYIEPGIYGYVYICVVCGTEHQLNNGALIACNAPPPGKIT